MSASPAPVSSANRVASILACMEGKKDFHVGVLGLGYVGLPIALEFAAKGFPVLGFDILGSRVQHLSAGHSDIVDIPSEELARALKEYDLHFTSDLTRLGEVNSVSICVPTPLSKSRAPDISFVENATRAVTSHCKENTLVVLESTTYPGCTREVLVRSLERRGLKVGENVFVGFSPERVDPGNSKFSMCNTPKVVSGHTENCKRLAERLYAFVAPTHCVTSTEEAEMVKLLENTFRAVNIALVNELAQMSHRMGINFWNVVEAASTKPFGFMPFYPGPGTGGHCIPLDQHYLSWRAKMFGFHNRFIELAAEVNENMPRFVTSRVLTALNKEGVPALGARILICGVAYKKNVGDTRESPSLELWTLLDELGAKVEYYDPYVPSCDFYAANQAHVKLLSVEMTEVVMARFDMVLICTDHECIDYAFLLKSSRRVFDTRNRLAVMKLVTKENERKIFVL